jgi:hypothetical protein
MGDTVFWAVSVAVAFLPCLFVAYVLLGLTPAGRLWIAGRSVWSKCWLGQHPWDGPGGHCEKCGACDEFFGVHWECLRKRGVR